MKYSIDKLEAVRSFFAEQNFTGRIRFYANGVEVPKAQAIEFSVPANAPEYHEPVVSEAQTAKLRKLPTKRKGATTKAQIVRDEILAHLLNDTYNFAELVSWSRDKFGWNRQLAEAYVSKSTERLHQMTS